MDLQFSASLISILLASVTFSGLLVLLVIRRRWTPIEHRFALYLVLALLANLSALASLTVFAPDESPKTILKIQFYIQAAQPLFFYAFARAFIRMEQKPLGFIVGMVLFAILVICDLAMVSLNLASSGYIPTASIVLAIRALIWVVFTFYIPILIMRELPQTPSPLDRNRLAYLVLALPFFIGYDLLDLWLGQDARPFIFVIQLAGVLILAYATLRHELVDLRYAVRQLVRYTLITTLTALVYISVFGAMLGLARRVDLASEIAVVFSLSIVLAVFFQPLYALVRREIDTILFGHRYSVQSVVQEFSHRLSTQAELEQLVLEGRALLRKTFGAIEVALLLVRHDTVGYTLRPIPQLPDWPMMIHLSSPNSIMDALSGKSGPLFQYDIDRLPRYADIPEDSRIALKRLACELYIPIRMKENVAGIWALGPKLSGERYTTSDLALLSTLADQSAVALENARLVADLREQMRDMRVIRDYLNSTLSSIASGVVTLDRNSNITSVNQAAETILGIHTSSAVGAPYNRIFPPLDGAQLPLLINRVLSQTAQHIVRDAVAQIPSRGAVQLTLHLSAMREGDELLGVAIVIEDLTEQARLELARRAQEDEKSRVRGTFERYVAPTVVERLLTDPRGITLGGERQLVTVLFADLHGFTNLSEKLAPEELVSVLNGYLSLAAQVVLKHEGTLDKFFGDGFMAIFNAPLDQPDHPRRAALTALMLQSRVNEYALGLPERLQLTFRIGMHTGDAIIGNIGASALMNYTAVGDTVNSAKRLQESAEAGQILMSKDTYLLVEGDVIARPLEAINVRGKSAPIEVFELIDLHGPRSNGNL